MNFQGSEKIFSSIRVRILIRVLVLYIFSYIFRSFDHSFIDTLEVFGFRGHLFSLFFVAFGLLVWSGGIFLVQLIEKRLAAKNTSYKLALLSCALIVYGLIVAFFFGLGYALLDICLFNRYEAWESFSRLSYDLNIGIFLFYLMLLTFNGIIFYYKGWKEYQLQAERLKSESIQAKYEALRNQIDPHFFFNSLSVLMNLVYSDKEVATQYIAQLAKTYRYILDKKFENLVSIQTELNFLDSYLFLIRIRHQQSVQFSINVTEKTKEKGMIPPATLQLLVENAIKHNRFSSIEPLSIVIEEKNDYLSISNTYSKKLSPDTHIGIGLSNIKQRYLLITSQEIFVEQQGDLFTVRIPIIHTFQKDIQQ